MRKMIECGVCGRTLVEGLCPNGNCDRYEGPSSEEIVLDVGQVEFVETLLGEALDAADLAFGHHGSDSDCGEDSSSTCEQCVYQRNLEVAIDGLRNAVEAWKKSNPKAKEG